MTTAVHPSVGKMTAEIPPAITTPDTLETRLGTLNLKDGFPDDATVAKVYDNLDFQRGVEAFLDTLPAATLVAVRNGMARFGPANATVAIFENLMDSRTVMNAPNTETVYTFVWIDLKNGPIVAENPPETVGFVADFWNRHVTDLGNAGPDQGKGGKYLFLPPGYKGEVPEGYFVCKSPTFGNLFLTRGLLDNGDTKAAVANIKRHLRVYPLAHASRPPAMTFANASGTTFNAVCALDFTLYEAVNQVVQEEPNDSMDPETLGVLAAIGIEKGKPFAPDARTKNTLTEAAMVASVTARALSCKPRLKEAYLYPNSAWQAGFIGGSYEFKRDNARLLDARTFFYFYGGFGASPGLCVKMVGRGSQYAVAFVDGNGRPLDGSQTYKLHLPPHIPAKHFWSIVVYDNQTRSMLQTDQLFPSISSQKPGIVANPDTSVDVYFGPSAPHGKEHNWVQTLPGKGFAVALRLYGPLEAWFDKTWRPSEVEKIT